MVVICYGEPFLCRWCFRDGSTIDAEAVDNATGSKEGAFITIIFVGCVPPDLNPLSVHYSNSYIV